MKKFYNTLPEEQETIINIDYFESKVIAYTCQKSVYERLLTKIGNPTKIYYTIMTVKNKVRRGLAKILTGRAPYLLHP